MKTWLLLAVLMSASLGAQAFTVTSGPIPGGYSDLGSKTDVSGGTASPMNNNSCSGMISPTGFNFYYRSQYFTNFYITDNGFMVLGPNNPTIVPALPDAYQAPGYFIAPMWADFDPYGNQYGYGPYGEIGWSFANQVLTVEWKYLERVQASGPYTLPAPGVRMQAVLDCTNGVIEFRYGDPDPNCWAKNANYNNACTLCANSVYFPGADPGYINSPGKIYYYPIERFVRFTPSYVPPVLLSPATLPNGTAGAAYSYQFTSSGGTQPHAFSSSNLPSGWTLSTSGLLNAPASAVNQGVETFNVTVQDAAAQTAMKAFTVNIGAPPFGITGGGALPDGLEGTAYGHQFTAQGATGAVSFNGTSLPSGFSLSSSGLLSAGAASVAFGDYVFSVTAQDSATPPHIDTRQFSLHVNAQALQINTSAIGPFTAGVGFSVFISASGGAGAYAWSGQNLPAGWGIDASSGELSAPAISCVAGSYNITLAVQGALAGSTQQIFTVDVIAPAALNIATSSLPNAVPGAAFIHTLAATGGVAPYAWGATGLPAGFAVSAGGVLTVSAAAALPGTYAFTLTISDSAAPAATDAQPVNLTVDNWPALVMTPGAMPGATEAMPYGQALSVNGGSGAGYSWSLVAGALPPGITGLPGNGASIGLSGTPAAAGSYAFTIEVADNMGNATQRAFTISVVPAGSSLGSAPSGGGGCTTGEGAGALWFALLLLIAAAAHLLRKVKA